VLLKISLANFPSHDTELLHCLYWKTPITGDKDTK